MYKKLFRIRRNKVIGGVCTGLGEYFEVDPVLIRIAFVILGFIHLLGVFLYIILWIIIPEKEETPFYGEAEERATKEEADVDYRETSGNKGRIILGVILIFLGGLFMANRMFPYFTFNDLLPIGLLVIGAMILWDALRG